MNRITGHIITALLLAVCSAYGQSNPLDSLSKELELAAHDTLKIKIYNDIGEYLRHSNPDSSLIFQKKALEICRAYHSDEPHILRATSRALQSIGIIHRQQGRYDKALTYHQEALEVFIKNNNYSGISQCYNNIGNVYSSIGLYDKAVMNYMLSIENRSSLNDKLGISDCYSNIGFVFKSQGLYEKALEYYLQSLELLEEHIQQLGGSLSNEIKRVLSFRYNNIGVVYWHQDAFDIALEYYQKSLEIKETIEDEHGISQLYNNIAIIYCNREDYIKGIEYFTLSKKVKEEIGDQNGLSMVYGNLSFLYTLLSDQAGSENERLSLLNQSLIYGQRGYELSKNIGSLSLQNESAEYLKEVYHRLGKYPEAFEMAQEMITIQAEIYSQARTDALAEMTTRYESERKQLQIEKMEQEKFLDNEIITKQRIIIYSTAFGLFVIVLFIFMLVRIIKTEQRANVLLSYQNEKINVQRSEISKQRDEIETQRDRLELHKKELEALYHVTLTQKNKLVGQQLHIESSIEYAKVIQTALLPNIDLSYKEGAFNVDSYFLIFKPKEVVSGDFYWFTRIDDWLVITVADCTGHGVPGAFMSMLGVSFLNQIAAHSKEYNPARILGSLRSTIIDALGQTSEKGTQRDGMEMSIASINTKTLECIWAGACNPLWIIRNNPTKPKSLDIVEKYRPDLMPVAAHFSMREYTNHKIQLKKGDRLYLFSDGFGDQFGGPNRKKFNMAQSLQRIIAETSKDPLDIQGKKLESVFKNWISSKGRIYEQTDDVTMLGIMV